MLEDGEALLTALNHATAAIKRNPDAGRRAAVLAGLHQELADLGYGPPLHPELDLQLRRITSMVASLHSQQATTAGAHVAEDSDQMSTPGLVRLSQLAKLSPPCSTLTICDGTLLQGLPGVAPRVYLADLIAALPPKLTQLEIFVKPGKRDALIAGGLNEHCSRRGLTLVHRLTKELHDRVWVMDHRRAFAIGTSFTGLADHCAFILELPREDRERFIGKLRVLREQSRWAPGMSMGIS